MYTLKNPTIALNEDYEVIVCGAGPAGCCAAIAAAREGAKTLLVEASGMLGGMSTLGMVNGWSPIHDGIRNIHQGIGGSIIGALAAQMQPLEPGKKWLPIDAEKLKIIYDKLVTQSGAQVLFHSMVAGVEMKDGRNIDVVLIANKAGLTAYRAKVFVDCTGDADLYAWAGKEFYQGDENGDLQAATMCFVVTGIDEQALAHMDEPYYTGQGLRKHALLHKIMKDGKYDIPDDHIVYRKIAPKTYSFNAGHVYNVDSTDPVSISRGAMQGRLRAWAIKNAYTEYAPETYGASTMVQTAPSLGMRESRRIIGDYTFTLDDYLHRRSFPDEVLRGKYHIDVHEERPDLVRDTTVMYEHYGVGESYGVPYRCMCPRDLDNVLVAGRTVSSDRITNGSLRVMPCCMGEGEAVGIAAKLASDMEHVNIHKVDTQLLRRRLMEEGAYLPKLASDTF